jgi:eukaryotic-like serine/threonine-protein kinase
MGVLAPEIEATYEVLGKMGEGGMGAVYKVRHRFFDEIRVIKVMQGQLVPLPELKERFLGEARRGKQLRHPNLAEVIDFSIAADGTSYMVMEYIEGVNLRDVLARNGGPLDYRVVVSVAEQALAALGFLHSRKFVHRDISPDNLMLTTLEGETEPRVKLIDLGIARSLEATTRLTMAGKFLGKVQYASPEHFSGEMDGRSDLYSLGIVLYELLTGEKPITGSNPMSLIGAHVSRPPRSFAETDPLGRVPPPIRQAVLKALEKRPEDRYATAAEFAEALRDALPPADRHTVEMPIVTVPADTPAPPASPTPSQSAMTVHSMALDPAPVPHPPPRRWPAIAAVTVLLLAVGAAALWMRSREVAVPAVETTPIVKNDAASGTVVTVQPAAERGQLVINALPWGDVTSVVDGAGVEHLRGTAETPLVLSLPPGAYKVRLTNPNSNRSVVRDATVTANAVARCEAELDAIDAAAYVDGIGIGR